MNIHEHQAKKILKKYGAVVPEGVFALTVDELVEKAKLLKTNQYVLKAQIHAGGRGKAGGVKILNTLEELKVAAKELLGKNTKNSNDFSKYLNNNYNTLLDAALNNIDFQKGGGISADWNTNPPTNEEFRDYYEASNEKPSTRADRKKSLNNAIARQIANEARIEFAKKDPATAEIFKKKHGVVLASKSQFDKPTSSLDREFRLETGDVNKLLNKYLGRGVYDLRKKENID